jgi:hypothetical protein
MTFMMRPSVSSPTGTEIGAPVSVTGLAAHQTFGRVHGDGADGVFAEMLGHFENQAVAVVRRSRARSDRRQVPSNCTSTTAPMTWRHTLAVALGATTLPGLALPPALPPLSPSLSSRGPLFSGSLLSPSSLPFS